MSTEETNAMESSQDSPEEGDGTSAGQPVEPAAPEGAGGEGGASEGEGDVEVPVGMPVSADSFSALKRRADQPDPIDDAAGQPDDMTEEDWTASGPGMPMDPRQFRDLKRAADLPDPAVENAGPDQADTDAGKPSEKDRGDSDTPDEDAGSG